MKKLLIMHDNNQYWKITGVEEREDDYIDPTKFFITTDEIYDFIKEKLANNIIIINKENLNSAVKIEDFILDEIDYSEKLRNDSRNLIYNSISGRFNFISMMELYNFILANNYMFSRGFYITDENKDDFYIDIIKSENEKDIEMLEKFLYAKDMLSDSYYWFEKYTKYKEDIEATDDKDEIDELTQNLLDKL